MVPVAAGSGPNHMMTGQPKDPDQPQPPLVGSGGSLDSTRSGAAAGSGPEQAAELADILENYLADLEAGRSPDRAALLARHPQWAGPLEEALAGLEFIRGAATAKETVPVQLGDFRILREIGRGGMGVVYEAEQVSLRRRVALKVLRFGGVADTVAMQRFQREAETVGRLHHTNIVPIFAIGADEGVRYFAMQFIEGRDLGRVARDMREPESGGLDFRRIADWGLQAAEALAHAHQRGVIHRDIKPSNLILDPDNRIWLTDFGLARRMDDVSLSLTGALLGTPRYMSPEQAASTRLPIDHRTDLYSLGATLYELVTGRPIFEATSPHEVISQILHTDPRPPRSLAPTLPRDLETIVLKCLAKEASRRYPTAQALAEDLRAFVAGRPIAARRPRVLERTLRWARQHRRLVGTAAVSGVVSVVLAGGGWLAWESYAASRLGHLRLSASVPGALAEILDAEGHRLVPLFPVPREAAIPLAAGSYQVRIAAPETLSETWPIEVAARSLVHHSLPLSTRWLWAPQDLGAPSAMERVPVGDHSGFLVFLPPEVAVAGQTRARPPRLRLIDGATAQPVWKEDLAFDASTLPGGDITEWQSLLLHWAVAPNFAGTHIGERATDLDRDGAPDFVLVSRSTASLLAISGASGRVLWWHRAHPALPPELAGGGRWNPRVGGSFVVSYPDMADLDGDGIADFVASFHSAQDLFIGVDGRTHQPTERNWVALISGRDGRELWRRSVGVDWKDYVSSSSGARQEGLAHAMVTELNGRKVVVLAENEHLRVWEGREGTPLDLAPAPGFAIDRAPLLFDPAQATDGGGNGTGGGTHALVFRRYVETDAHLELVAIDLRSGAVAWKNTPLTVLGGVANELDAMPRESVTAVNLEKTGPSEIVTLTGRHPREGKWTFGVQVLDAATGRARWETALHDAGHPQSIPSEARFLVGPDLDRDGSREIFVVLPAYDSGTKQHGLLSAALSGADGAVLWRRHHPGIAGARSLAWWQPGPDGWPMLVATTSEFSGGRSSTVILQSGSGQIAHLLLDVREVQVADLDGDGALDLLHPVRSQNALRWVAIRGQPVPAWKRLGTWLAGPDANEDAAADFYELAGDRLSARSGRDGRTLWTTTARFAMPESLWTEPLGHSASTNGPSGKVVAAVQLPKPSATLAGPEARTLAAFSAKDGKRLWTADELDLGMGTRGGSSLGWAYDYPGVEFADLDHDGASEVLVSLPVGDDASRLQLKVLSGDRGRVLWETPIIDGAMSPDPRPSGAPLADFNGDGLLDLALIVPPAVGGKDPAAPAFFGVEVLQGMTGRPVWPNAFPLVRDPRHIAWPEPVLGDLDGDRVPEVLVVRHGGYRENRGYGCELVVLEGRSGLVRWTWKWDAGFPAVWAPLVLTAPEPARRRVALGLTSLERGGFEIAVLNAAGVLEFRREVIAVGHPPDRGGLAWSAVDLDSDGTDELVYPSDGHLCAGFGPDLGVIWRRPLAGSGGDGFRLVPELARRTGVDAGGGEALVLWTGYDVFGLRGADGAAVWRGRAPVNPVWGVTGARNPRLVRLGSGKGASGLQFPLPLGRGDVSSMESTWPTHSDGRYRSDP